MIRIDDWCIVPGGTPYTAPELITSHLYGVVTGHPNEELNGKAVTTSAIVGFEDGCIVTRSGSHYVLGEIEPGYEETYPNARERLINLLIEKRSSRMEKGSYTPCWKTSDGEVFEDELEAADHQKKVNRCIAIDDILQHPQTYPQGRNIHEDTVITDFLMGNWDTLTRLFKS